MRRKWLFIAPLAVLGFLVFIAIGGEIVRLLWNWLMTALFGWPAITFWQALGLMALCRILFGGFGGRGFARGRHRMGERWERMTPEEREHVRRRMRERFGCETPSTPNVDNA